MESSNYSPSPLVSQDVTIGIAGSDYNRSIPLIGRIKNTTNSRNKRVIRSEIMALGPKVTSIKSNKL